MQLYTLRNERDQITNNRDEVIKIVEKFHRKLYSCNDRQIEDPNIKTMNIEVPNVNTSEIKKALKGMSRSKQEVQMAY